MLVTDETMLLTEFRNCNYWKVFAILIWMFNAFIMHKSSNA